MNSHTKPQVTLLSRTHLACKSYTMIQIEESEKPASVYCSHPGLCWAKQEHDALSGMTWRTNKSNIATCQPKSGASRYRRTTTTASIPKQNRNDMVHKNGNWGVHLINSELERAKATRRLTLNGMYICFPSLNTIVVVPTLTFLGTFSLCV